MTTSDRIATDLRESLNLRGINAGMTVATFIDALLDLGVRMSDPLGSIEFGIAQHGTRRVTLDIDEHGSLEIREVLL